MPSGDEVTRRTFLVLLAPAAAAASSASQRSELLDVRLDGALLKVAAPKLRFITGKPLQRLRDGAPVPFAIQLSLRLSPAAASPVYRDIQRSVLSYDLWEQRFSVTRLGPGHRTASHPTAEAAEAWCLSEMSLDPAGLATSQRFWVRLEIRAEDPVNRAAAGGDSMTLARLIEIFSRRTRGEEKSWNAEAGPFSLADLRRGQAAAARKRLGRAEAANASDGLL